MRTLSKWKWAISLLLMAGLYYAMPVTGALSTKLNATDNMRENIETLLTIAETGTTHSGKTLSYAQIDTALSGADVELVAAVAGDYVYVVEMLLTVDAQCQIAFTDGAETAGAVAPQLYLPAYGGIHLKRDAGYRFSGDVAEALAIDAVAGSPNVSGYIWYYQE